MTEDGLDVPNCPRDLHAMEPMVDVHEIVADGYTSAEGFVWWQCPVCGLTRIT